MSQAELRKGIVRLLTGSALLLLGLAEGGRADEITELKEQLKAQQRIMQQMHERLEQLEARQSLEERSLTEKIEDGTERADEKPPATALPDSLKWLEKIKISGDLRYRHEHIDSETVRQNGTVGWRSGRDRERIRARLMFEAMVNSEWDLGLRLGTGESGFAEDEFLADPVSANQTLRKFSSSKDFWLDLAYADYHPKAIEGLNVTGGKMKNPFYKVGKNQLVFDNDLNPEGLASQYVAALTDADTLHVNGAAIWVDESSGGVDTFLWGAQGYVRHDLGEPDYVLAGASFWDYGNIQGKADEYGILFGNTDGGGGTWASDFDVLEVFAEYGSKAGQLPLAVFGTWVENTVATTSEDTGWLVGGKLGKAEDIGSWEFDYDYRDLEGDAVLGVWADSDFIGGGTGGKGHRFGFTYQLAKNVQAGLIYFHDTLTRGDGPDLDFRRLHLDLRLKF